MVVDINADFFGLTEADLDASEKRVPIYAIANMLTPEQLAQVEGDDLIKVSLLTSLQLSEVNAAIEFDRHLSQIGHEVKDGVHKYL